jgi:hypothetical protein
VIPEPTLAHFSPPGKLPDPEELLKWAKTLDAESKGFVSNRDMYEALFACGLEPTIVEMDRITSLVDDADRTRASLELFIDLGVSQEKATELIAYYRREGFQMRPDNFRYLRYRRFFWTRLLGYLVPFVGIFTQHWQIPNLTPFEQGPYKIIHYIVIPVAAIGPLLCGTQFLLWSTGATETIKLPELITTYLTLCGLGLATQVAREAVTVSREGVRVMQRSMASVTSLRYTKIRLTNGKAISGTDALVYFTRACSTHRSTDNTTDTTDTTNTGTTAAAANDFLLAVCKISALAYHNANNASLVAKRRSSSIALEAQEMYDAFHSADAASAVTEDAMNRKYNYCSLDSFGKVLSISLGVLFLCVPTMMGYCRGEVTMFHSDATTVDVLVDVMSTAVLFFGIVPVAFVILGEAVTELAIVDEWTKFLVGSICEGTGWRNASNVNLDFHLRLDCPAAIDSFEILYNAVLTVSYCWGAYHKAAFEVLTIVSVASVVAVFVGSVLDLELDTWNVMLFAMGAGVLIVSTRVFSILVIMHKRLGDKVVMMLRHQKRLNSEAIILQTLANVPDENKTKTLTTANLKLDILLTSIPDGHKPMLLLGVIPLTKDNVVKGGFAVGAGLFTTVLRTSINF